MTLNKYLDIAPEVQKALDEGRPVVALESTIISHGMPYPQNVETALNVEKLIRENGAVPATIAVIGGRLKAGLSEAEIDYLGKTGAGVTKASRRDLPILVAEGRDGATTVTTTMIIAHMAGIQVFATGGIGGVHRGAQQTFDISADLEELAHTPVMVVCAGAKSILDLGLTLEYLETHGVPVIGYGTEELPAFYTRKSGFKVDYRIDTPAELAKAFYVKQDMGLGGGMLVGVTAAEMPASFAEEALKAQAVAARTYTLYKLTAGSSHGDTADICTDSTCCQAYIAMEQARANWGAQADAYEKKVRDAVISTDGEAILYGGVPILAVFHSSSAGLTRAAGQVWQNDLPYLKPVDSPEAKETIPNYYSRVDFTPAALKEKLLAKIPSADLSGDKKSWLKDPIRDSAGSVETVEVGGVTVRGGTVRAALGLRSACFEWELQDGNFVFYVTGYGHGVGLSQYGADAMAESGADYQTILTHYYTGVTVEVFTG